MMMGAMMAMDSTQSSTGYPDDNSEILRKSKSKPKEVIPKGCKKYWFSVTGRFYNDYPGDHYNIVFECIAKDDRNAERKYNKWVEKKSE